jgi:DNA invertase Pin-like site-specific DNA recombinase
VTTSPDTQRAMINKEACDDLEIVEWAVDLDISAADYAPKDRAQLGPWLSDPEKIEQYDVLIFAMMDRGIRSVVDLYWLLGFCKEYGKELIFAKEKLDTSTSVGRIVATLLAAVAEIEIENMVERRQRASAFLRGTARWAGGPAPYGYAAVDNREGDGKILVIAEDDAAILREIVDRASNDEPLASIADDLNTRGVLTSRSRSKSKRQNKLEVKGWSSAVLTRMLRSMALLGRKEQQQPDGGRKLLLDSSGRPIQMAPPLITLDQWQKLQAALDRGSRPQPRGKAPHPLAGSIFCGDCGSPMRKHAPATRPARTYKFRCYGDGCRKVSQYIDIVWSAIEDSFLHHLGGHRVMTRVYVPGEDHTVELDDVKARIKTLREARYVRGEFDGEEAEWKTLMDALLRRRDELAKLPQRKGGWDWREGEQTYGELWESRDESGRADLLKRSGITVRLFPAVDRQASMKLDLPPDLAKRVGLVPV